jgi:hypothetical protein
MKVLVSSLDEAGRRAGFRLGAEFNNLHAAFAANRIERVSAPCAWIEKLTP